MTKEPAPNVTIRSSLARAEPIGCARCSTRTWPQRDHQAVMTVCSRHEAKHIQIADTARGQLAADGVFLNPVRSSHDTRTWARAQRFLPYVTQKVAIISAVADMEQDGSRDYNHEHIILEAGYGVLLSFLGIEDKEGKRGLKDPSPIGMIMLGFAEVSAGRPELSEALVTLFGPHGTLGTAKDEARGVEAHFIQCESQAIEWMLSAVGSAGITTGWETVLGRYTARRPDASQTIRTMVPARDR